MIDSWVLLAIGLKMAEDSFCTVGGTTFLIALTCYKLKIWVSALNMIGDKAIGQSTTGRRGKHILSIRQLILENMDSG